MKLFLVTKPFSLTVVTDWRPSPSEWLNAALRKHVWFQRIASIHLSMADAMAKLTLQANMHYRMTLSGHDESYYRDPTVLIYTAHISYCRRRNGTFRLRVIENIFMNPPSDRMEEGGRRIQTKTVNWILNKKIPKYVIRQHPMLNFACIAFLLTEKRKFGQGNFSKIPKDILFLILKKVKEEL